MSVPDGDGRVTRDARDDAGGETVDAAFEAGVALFNAGHVLAARDRWEAARSAVADGPAADGSDAGEVDDVGGAVDGSDAGEVRVLRGLAAAATAADRAGDGDRSAHMRDAERSDAAEQGARALTLLEGTGEAYRGLALEPVREWCRRLAAAGDTAGSDPGPVDATPDPFAPSDADPPTLRIDGVAVGFEELGLAATLAAAPALAAAVDAGEEPTLAAAARLAREERGTGRTQVTELVFAYLRRPEARPQIAARIADHVDRDRRERRDVSGLFE
ncbi:hypothetical protein DJ70_13915 [Halorubrum halodurans]|uniref:DUF309 domain-containing protein n=1 Tax=Halorubrum halodurans TaxID=1383851 RepID=A0A256ID79_9EURY|nr:hypothetical protein DJ70_13915 [Halorubrum halodurans]